MRSVEQVHRQSGVMLQLGFELYGAGRPESAFALGTKCLGNDSHPGFAQCAYQCIRMLPCNLRVAGMHANAILKKIPMSGASQLLSHRTRVSDPTLALSYKLIHSCQFKKQLPAPGQYSISADRHASTQLAPCRPSIFQA